MEIRQKVLCDEHCGRFEQRVRLISQHVRHIMNFITDADETIDELIKKNPGLITNGVLRQFADFGLICKWGDKILVSCCLLVPLCHFIHNYAKNAFIVAVSLR